MFNNQYIANISSDFIFIILLILLGYLWISLTRRNKLYRFFALNRLEPKVIIYTSNLGVSQKGSTVDFRGLPRSYTGSAIPEYELSMIPPILRLFNTIVPGVDELPNILKKITLSEVDIEHQASPSKREEIDFSKSTIFTFGSPGYNCVSEYVQNDLNPLMKMLKDNMEIRESETNQVVGSGRNVAFLQKVYEKNNKRWVFYTAGIDENGTKGSLLYLIRNWRELFKKYDDKQFAICFEFPWSKQDPHGYNKPKILKEL